MPLLRASRSTRLATVLGAPTESGVVSPQPEQNRVDAVGQVSRASIAKQIWEDHCNALEARRQSDLMREMLLLHMDGSGDAQWAVIMDNARVEIPTYVSEFRKNENVLRLLAANSVAHHTTMPLRYFASSSLDRRSRERALIDSLWANHLAYEQDFNGLSAEALWLAHPAGFCPIHAYWRDGTGNDWESVGSPLGVGPGSIDVWVGNPFDHVFDLSARRNSIRWSSYGRILPRGVVQAAFPQVPELRGIEGSDRIPSAAEYQNIALSWAYAGMGRNGTPLMTQRRNVRKDGTEPLVVICREIARGVDSRYPEGRLQIIAVPGHADARRRISGGAPILLADQPLPAGDFSFSLLYSDVRGSDVHGKPWIEDMDQLQIELNIALSQRWEFIQKQFRSPILAPGGALGEDFTNMDGYSILEVEPSLANWHPRAVEWPQWVWNGLNQEVQDKRQALYRAGGYQAVSRGESPGSRMAYRAILALQQADNTIHGPVNQRYRRAMCDLMRRCWRQFKTYGDVGWLVQSGIGEDYAYLLDSYIDKTMLSDVPPHYKLVNAFGATPEIQTQELLDLVARKGSDGKPILTTEEFRRAYPNQGLFDNTTDPAAVVRRRARTVAQKFVDKARAIREEQGIEGDTPADPAVQQAAQQVFYAIEAEYPRLRDDDLMASISALTEITQDESADPIARLAAMQRQELMFAWQAQQAAMAMPAQGAVAPQTNDKPGPDQRIGSVREARGDEPAAGE
jgi:hypothetical protein